MNLSKHVPAFRIEVRRAGSAEDAPWTVAELAHSDAHVKAKLPFWKNQEDIEARVVDNFTVQVATPVIAAPPAPAAVTMHAPLTVPPAIVATAPAAIAPVVAGTPEAITAPSPELPFKVGDRLQDIHVPDHPPLFVDQINPDGRPGFSWTMPDHPNPTSRAGFVGLNAVGNFLKASGKVVTKLDEPAAKAPPASHAPAAKAEKKTVKPAKVATTHRPPPKTAHAPAKLPAHHKTKH